MKPRQFPAIPNLSTPPVDPPPSGVPTIWPILLPASLPERRRIDIREEERQVGEFGSRIRAGDVMEEEKAHLESVETSGPPDSSPSPRPSLPSRIRSEDSIGLLP